MARGFEKFMDMIFRFGMEYYRRYYGPYRAQVVSNQDPQKMGRVLVECPRAKFHEDNANWVLPMMAGAGDAKGMFWPPEKDDYVWVFFDNGDPTCPCAYLGGWYAPDELDDDFDTEDDGTPKRRGFKTPGGHSICLDDTSGTECVKIRHKDGTIVQWTENKTVEIGKEGGSFEPLVKGDALKQYIESHTHPHSWGPTGPPIQPLPPNVLSKDTKTS